MKNKQKSLFVNKDEIACLRRFSVVAFVFQKSYFSVLTREKFNDKVKTWLEAGASAFRDDTININIIDF